MAQTGYLGALASATTLRTNVGGILAMLLATSMFTICDSTLKVLGRDMPVGEMLFLRGVMSWPIIFFIVVRAGVLARLPAVATDPRILVRTAFEICSTIFFVVGLVHLPFADAIGIQQFAPLAVMAGAAILLREPVGWRRWLAAFAGFVGVMVIVRPGAATLNWPALLVLGCVACLVGRDLVTRRLRPDTPSVLVATMSIVFVGLSGLLLAPFETWVVPTPWQMTLVGIAAVSSIFGFYWIVEALRRGEVSVVMPFRYSLIPFSVFSSIVVFGQWPDATTFIGMAIVLAAGLYAVHRERIRLRHGAAR